MMNKEIQEIKTKALSLLGQHEYSQHLLKQKLISKGFDRELIAEVLQELVQQNWLSDQRFAENFVSYRAHRGYGPIRIQMELREKGIAAETIEGAICACDTEWEKLAAKERQKKFGDSAITNFAEKAKQMKFLQYRGFAPEQIKFAISNCEL
jgi:regulatory protein